MVYSGETERIVKCLSGDCTVLCVVVATPERVVIVVNDNYPEALAHAERHLDGQTSGGVWICAPDCAV